VAFSPDGQRIVTGVGEWDRPDRKPGEAKVWDARTGQELLSLKHTKWSVAGVWSVAFSPDGQRIATGIAGANATVKVWSAAPTP
jgi:WD40 repeat protein